MTYWAKAAERAAIRKRITRKAVAVRQTGEGPAEPAHASAPPRLRASELEGRR